MPIREYECEACNVQGELIHPSLDPAAIPKPACPKCNAAMELMWSLPNLDTETNFAGRQNYSGPDGRMWKIDSLHKMRKVEKAYEETGHNIRFDAYSANPNNPDVIDGMGLEYWDGDKSKKSSTREIVSLS